MVITLDQKFYKWGRNAQLIKQAVSFVRGSPDKNTFIF
jgi:hypothetical protein